MLFDLGGTLDADGEHWLNRFHLLYRQVLPEVSWGELKAAFYAAEEALGMDPRAGELDLAGVVEFHVARQLGALGRPDQNAARFLSQKFLASCREAFRRNAPVLARLAPRLKLGVVTNYYGNARRILKDAGLTAWLAVVVDSGAEGVRKPEAAIFELALRRLNLTPDQTAFVGDSYSQDVRPAKLLGLTTVWLRNDAMSAPLPADFDPTAADFEISRLAELEALML
jgi:HAD superfamily hydrolase (TIGR01509 family)